LVFDLTAQEGGMVREGTLSATSMGFGGTAAAMAKPLPQFLHEGETDTETRRNSRVRGGPGGKGINNTITEVLRVRFHILIVSYMDQICNCNPL
jgi:hypothetical protein